MKGFSEIDEPNRIIFMRIFRKINLIVFHTAISCLNVSHMRNILRLIAFLFYNGQKLFQMS